MNIQSYFQNFADTLGSSLPSVLGALLVFIIGWFIASGLGRVAGRLIGKSNLQQRLGSDSIDLSKTVRKFVYYILMIIVLMVVLEMLGVKNVLAPLQNMVNEFLTFLPNIVAGGIIGFAGYLLATIASDLVGLAGGSIEKLSYRLGRFDDIDFTKIIKQIVFLFVFIPIAIAGLDTLGIEAISKPATQMLSSFMTAIPKIIAAALIIAVFYIVGKYVTQMLTQLLVNLNVDEMSEKLNIGSILGTSSLSKLIGNIAYFFIMFGGILTATDTLGFEQISGILNNSFEIALQIFGGLIILIIGNFIANLAKDALSSAENGAFLGNIARVVVLGLFFAIALRTMGIANDIVNLAFGLTLGAVAVAVALSFGLGGREAAGEEMARILKRFRSK